MKNGLVAFGLMACALALLVPGHSCAQAGSETEAALMAARWRRWCEDAGARYPGSPGNLAIEASVLKAFADSGFQHGALAFDAPVFIAGKTQLRLPDGEVIAILPMHPTLMRPGNFSDGAFESRLVYLGEGSPDDLERASGIQLENALAVMEPGGGSRWMDLLRFGIRGFIFLAADQYSSKDAAAKVFNTEVAVPRFFAPDKESEALRRLLESAAEPVVGVAAEPSVWRVQTLQSPWVLVPGDDPDLARDIVMMTAPLDAGGVVPELAYGGDTSGNLMLMLDLLEGWRKAAPKRSVLLVAVNAHTQGYLGERVLAWHLLADTRSVAALRDLLAREMRVAGFFEASYRRLRLDPVEIPAETLDAVMNLLWALHGQSPPEDPASIEDARIEAALDEAVRRITDRQRGIVSRMTLTADDRAHASEAVQRIETLRRMERSALRALLAEAHSAFLDEQLLEAWRTEVDGSIGVRLTTKSRLQDTIQRELNIVKMELMDGSRRSGVAVDEMESMRALRERLTKLLVLFNKIDIGRGRHRVRYREIASDPESRLLLLNHRDLLVARLSDQAEQFRLMLEQDGANGSLRTALGTHRVRLALSLGIDWSAERFGFLALNHLPRNEWYRRMGGVMLRLAEDRAGTLGAGVSLPYVDALSGAGGVMQESVFPDTLSPAGLFQAADGTPSLALRSAYARRRHAFTPRNRIDDLAPVEIHRLAGWILEFLKALPDAPGLTDSDVCPRLPVAQRNILWSTLVRTFEMDEFASRPTPSLPVPGCLVAGYQISMPSSKVLPSIVDGDVANVIAGMSDRSGHALLYGIWTAPLAPFAYQMDERFVALTATIDKGRIQQPGQNDSNMNRSITRTFPLFSAAEFVIADRADPSLAGSSPISVQELWPTSGDSLSTPQKYGTHGVKSLSRVISHASEGPAGVYQEFKKRRGTTEPLMLLTGNKRFAVNSAEEKPEGIGFSDQVAFGRDFFLQAARDMDLVTRHRVGNMPGIVNELVTEFLDGGRAALRAAMEAASSMNHPEFRRQTALAVGNQVKAYEQVRTMNADMLKAIMVYMALMLPFCFFLQKLLFTFNKIEHEIGMFVLMFILTYTGFRLIHPAFAIAMSAEAIFLAFVLGTLGCFVTWMLHGRFSAEMDMLFRGMSGYMGEAAAGFVGQTAMLIGVGNMKRRRTRTALTTATVVLVVFTMLAFSSVSRKARPTIVQLSPQAPYTGLFFNWPGRAVMDEQTPRVFEALFAGHAEILVRRAILPADTPSGAVIRWRIEREGLPERWAGITAGVGLSVRESAFSGEIPILYGREFASDDAMEIIVTATLAEALGLAPADLSNARVRFQGLDLAVVGIMDDDRFRMLRDLDPNATLLPRRAGGAGEANTGGVESKTDKVESVLDLSEIVFLPPEICRELGGGPVSVSVRLEDGDDQDGGLWARADELLRATRASFCIGSTKPFHLGQDAKRTTEAGVYRIAGAYRTTIGGLARLVVPLLIAGLILFNTMLGTVYERKSEIAIYNAIGLNPHHIFSFFLAEALVYGVIGAIGGYLIGQILAIVAQTFNLVRGMNVNFSSLMVVWAILFTVALVLLSTIYPAFVATRTAVPSGTRRWALPPHDGQVMNVDMPFIYEPALAPGVMAYLHEHFSASGKHGLGDMIVDVRQLRSERVEGRPVYLSEYGVALAPFDLGVTQAMRLRAEYSPSVESYHLELSIRRESGQDTSWASVNQPLLEKLRKMLLRWRNMDPSRREEYCATGRQHFGE